MAERYEEALYPFLFERDRADAEAVLASVVESSRQKAEDVIALRRTSWEQGKEAIVRAAIAMADAFAHGGTLYVFGNGGSATDAQDVAADFMRPALPGRRPLPCYALTVDTAVITAVGNDVHFENVFLRQIIAFGRPGDIALGISTSGNSPNVLKGLEQAKRQGMLTVAVVGYDGGEMGRSPAVDHVLLTPSTYVPRIQEAQGTVLHLLWELIHRVLEARERGEAA